MKNVVEPGSNGPEFTCDCCGKEAFGQLSIHFWYGSKYDMNQGNRHLCDECAKNIMEVLKREFGMTDFLTPIIEF